MFFLVIETFTVNTPTARIVLKSELDYEHTRSYSLTLRITDIGKATQPSGNVTVKVTFLFFFFILNFTVLQEDVSNDKPE